MAAASKVKLARNAQADDRMEVNGGERRQIELEAVDVQSPFVVQAWPVFSDTAASLEPPPTFKMVQELTVAHALKSKRDDPHSCRHHSYTALPHPDC
jgi:hypothetical protein